MWYREARWKARLLLEQALMRERFPQFILTRGVGGTLVWRGDIGGFGVGSDFSWHTTAYASWQVAEHGNLLIGYRHLDVDYEDGSGASRFKMDVSEGGPTVGFAWGF